LLTVTITDVLSGRIVDEP